nr:Taste receptor type 1 member 1 like [Ipomoea batatas]
MVEGEAGDWRSGEAEDRAMKPPPPPVEETELRRWPLNFLESKLTAGILLASGLGLIVYAGISTGDWKEFYQYFRQSRFIHAMSIDFVLLSAFAPFWVFNDMTTRKWYNKGSWLLPVSVVPFLGPALYLLLRPPVPAVQASSSLSSLEEE